MPGVLLCFRNPKDIQMILDALQFTLVIKTPICFTAGTAGIYLSSVELVLTDVCYPVKLWLQHGEHGAVAYLSNSTPLISSRT